jgi:hypothetical protein
MKLADKFDLYQELPLTALALNFDVVVQVGDWR